MQWIRPNTTAEQTQQDGAECRIAAYVNYPYKELVVEHTQRDYDRKRESNDPRCGCRLLPAGQRLQVSAPKLMEPSLVHVSLTTFRGSLSSRIATNLVCRSLSASVHSAKSTLTTASGFSQMQPFIFSAVSP